MPGEIKNPAYGAGNNKVLEFYKGTYFKPIVLPAIGSHQALACHLRYRVMAGVNMSGTPRMYWGICNRASFNPDNPFSTTAHGFHLGQYYNPGSVANTTLSGSFHGPNLSISIGHYGRTAGGTNFTFSGGVSLNNTGTSPSSCMKDGVLSPNACMDAGFGIHETSTTSSWWAYWHNQFDSLGDSVMDIQGASAFHNQMASPYAQNTGALSGGWAGCSPAQPINSLATNRAIQELDSMFVSWSSSTYPIQILAIGVSVIA